MTTPSHHRRTAAFLIVGVALMLACGISTTSSGSSSDAAATQAAMELQGTAMVLQLTQSALNAPVQPANPPAAAVVNTPTATVAPRIVISPGIEEVTYGQKISHYPRKALGVTYGFKGTQGDNVTILVASSSARPSTDAKCIGLTASTAFTLRGQSGGEMPATIETAHLSSMRDYKLPATAAYYVTITCGGGACNGYCTQADLSVNKN